MIEIPEAVTLARQITEAVGRKTIKTVIAGYSPHKFAWYHGDPAEYNSRLRGKTIGTAVSRGGLAEVAADDMRLLFGDGVALRFHPGDKRPAKHQLLVEFEDGTSISASVQMYGGMWCFREGEFDNPYFHVAWEKPSPLSNAFDRDYFGSLRLLPFSSCRSFVIVSLWCIMPEIDRILRIWGPQIFIGSNTYTKFIFSACLTKFAYQ